MTHTVQLPSSLPRQLDMDVSSIRLHAELRSLEALVGFWSNPLIDIPVDVTVVAKRLGASVFWGEMDDVEGYLYCPVGSAPEITVNTELSKARKRFATAHELGHLLYVRDTDTFTESGFVDTFDDLNSESLQAEAKLTGRQTESISKQIYANAFASSLLMPRRALLSMVDAGLTDERIAQAFEVPLHVARYRMATLPG